MDKNKYFVIDITTLTKWDRSPVGIIRTQLEFTHYLIENFQDTIYFSFNATKDKLIEIERSEIKEIVDNLLNYQNKTIFNQNNKKFVVHNNKIKILLNKIIYIYKTDGLRSLLIKICKKKCPPFLKYKIKTFYNKFLNNKKTINNKTTQYDNIENTLFSPEIYQSLEENVSFLSSNAILISMGLDWDNSNYPMLYWLKKKIGFKFIGAFYDGIPVIYPHLVQSYYFSQKFFSHLYYLIYLSDKIFCISDYSKKQLQEICVQHQIKNLPALKTIHLGDSIMKKESHFKQNKSRKHKKDYVLYVSTVESRKNHILLLKVWHKIMKEKNTQLPDLVLVGMLGWGIDELLQYFENNQELKSCIYFYDDVDDEELSHLYKNSKFTVFPSFVEGWGLGAVESMLYEKPCIISSCPALIEATQGLMPSLSPTDIQEWVETIKKWTKNDNEIIKYKKIIKEKFKSKSWMEFSKDFVDFARDE